MELIARTCCYCCFIYTFDERFTHHILYSRIQFDRNSYTIHHVSIFLHVVEYSHYITTAVAEWLGRRTP